MKSPADNPINAGLGAVQRDLYRPLLERLTAEMQRRAAKRNGVAGAGPAEWVEFLKARIGEEMQALEKLRVLYGQFIRALSASRNTEDQQQLILNFSRDLGASPPELKKDAAAFARWFGADAMTDRFQRRQAAHEHYVAFLLERLGAVAAGEAAGVEPVQGQMALWRALALEPLLKPLLVHEGDPRLRVAAFGCLSRILAALNPEIQERAVDDTTLQYIYRSALQHQQDVWIQCAALELLVTLSWPSFERALEQRLLNPAPGDDLFVRRRAALLLARHFPRCGFGRKLAAALLADPSPFVRQALPELVLQAPPPERLAWAESVLARDPSPQVRAAMWLKFPELLHAADTRRGALRLFRELPPQEHDEFALRVICLAAERATTLLADKQDPFIGDWQAAVTETLVQLRCGAPGVKVRRWASQALEFIWSESDPETRSLRNRFAALARATPRGRSRRIPRSLTEGHDPAYLGRIWSVVCRHDYDVQLQPLRRGYKVIRGHVFGFRWWRWWHEFRHPSPDKRQAFPHTIGRVFDGSIHVPSAIMAELAQTKVPGEPLQMADEAGWRPYLPLLDELTSSVELGARAEPVRIFSSEGITTVAPPRGWKRWIANWHLTWRFRQLAEKRNWLPTLQEPSGSYVSALQELGFEVRFEPYCDRAGRPLPPDPAVERFFAARFLPFALPAPVLEGWDRFRDYFVSLYQNSILELAVFTIGFAALFFGLHLFFNARLKHWRKRIPLVVGGWGTRGKSGTERLKAALFNAMGLGVVSKTTGCEAMFLQAYPFGQMKEMFLFRPYDKATIWEQVNVVRIAGRLKTDVMLWECMGLTPSYVKILQRSWMRDQYSTITNTYPDHEDLQGPAGINIPEVIGCFIPQNSTLITSEEQMLPILASEAERRKTTLYPVTWLDAGLIPVDILQRFPYEEHPCNIALVLGLAEQLGIPRDFALKEMADRVVPDLGVLKTYPVATRRTRRLEFTNGMSANERFGTISNWTRTGFDRQDCLKEPGVWLTTVVNNRADRVPRSQVFARVLVNDLAADRHVLVGGNLTGLLGYIGEAWAEKAPQISLWKEGRETKPADGLEVLEQQALQMRLPVRPELIREHLRIMLAAQPQINEPGGLLALWEHPDQLQAELEPLKLGEVGSAILANLRHELGIYLEYRAFREQVAAANPDKADVLNRQFRELLQKWFMTKVIVVEDYYASGDQIIELITGHTPPGFLNRIMGIQNIKGTGLDFVYRWQAWQTCYNAAAALRGDSRQLTPQALAPLSAFEDYGVLCEEYVRDAVHKVKSSPRPPHASVLAELDSILQKLDAAMERVRQKMTSGGGQKGGRLTSFLLRVEEFLDAGDAVRRRSQADQIYEDLIAERISRQRAVTELQELTQRQKGGWLLKKFARA